MLLRKFCKNRILNDRERKNISIFNMLRHKSPIAKTDISRAISLNIVTVSNYIEHYMSKGLVSEKGLAISTGGRRPLLIELNCDAKYVIGVTLTLTSISAVCINLGGKVIHSIIKDRPVKTDLGLIDELLGVTTRLINEMSIDTKLVDSIMIGISGALDSKSGTVTCWAPSEMMQVTYDANFTKRFEQTLGIRAFLQNDADMAVFGEYWFTGSITPANMVYFYGGIGCGLIFNGEIYQGATGAAGELGINHKEVPSEEWEKNSLELGAWELGMGMLLAFKKKVSEGKTSAYVMRKIDNNMQNLTLQVIFEAVSKEDPLIMEILDEATIALGRKIAFVVNVLNPQVVVVGGGIEEAGPLVIENVKKMLEKHCHRECVNSLQILPSKLGQMGVSLGAAAMGVYEIFRNA